MLRVGFQDGRTGRSPSLHETSHYAHFVAMRNPSFFARRVGFIEIMVPCLRRTSDADFIRARRGCLKAALPRNLHESRRSLTVVAAGAILAMLVVARWRERSRPLPPCCSPSWQQAQADDDRFRDPVEQSPNSHRKPTDTLWPSDAF